MREIKFRAWDKKLKRWAYIDLDNWAESNGPMAAIGRGSINNLELLSDDQYEWVQFTGLKDKNGVEIYEGDVLSVPAFKNNYSWPVSIDNKHAYRFLLGGDQLLRADAERGEIIGNIHRNPELQRLALRQPNKESKR